MHSECLLAFTRVQCKQAASARIHAHGCRIPPRVRVLRDTHSTRWHTACLLCIHAPTPTSCARATECACICTSVCDEQMRTCVNVQDLVAFANDAGTMYRTQFSIVLYIRYIGTIRLHLPASNITCLNRSRFRKKRNSEWFQERRFVHWMWIWSITSIKPDLIKIFDKTKKLNSENDNI